MRIVLASPVLLLLVPSIPADTAGGYRTIDLHVDGSRTLPVHLIPLHDEYDDPISPYDPRPEPFSPRVTCGRCHNYQTISSGWHFNSTVGDVPPGRPGEPWVLADDKTGTQIPVSARGWRGTWRPEQLGLTPWRFAKTFARHTPGGDMGEAREEKPDIEARWHISGRLEINCLVCHNADRDQDQSEWVKQVARENFRWAPAAASGLAVVENVAARLPETYDPIDPPNPDNPWAAPPEVTYDKSKFDSKNRVFFDIVRKPPANRCYFCHSVWYVNSDQLQDDGADLWKEDGDVHMMSGMSCSDCHRNGLDHAMVRGYEGEATDPSNLTLTCRGCHLGDDAAADGQAFGGRFMAPRPKHKGLPAVHIETMTCTSCHSGPWPGPEAGTVRTSRANRMGVHGRARWYTDTPSIVAPVFARGDDGKTGLYFMMWPAFWARLEGDRATPLPMALVTATVDTVLQEEEAARRASEQKPAEQQAAEQEVAEPTDAVDADAEEAVVMATAERAPKSDRRLTQQHIVKVLTRLTESAEPGDKVGYICNGKCYTLSPSGELVSAEHAAGSPYAWAMGHDVRPAAQSLGAGGCSDCHASGAPFFFASVSPKPPVLLDPGELAQMYELQDQDPALLAALDREVRFRKPFIVASVVLSVILAWILMRYGVLGLEAALRALVVTVPKRKP